MLTLQVNLLEYRVTSFGEKVWLDNIALYLIQAEILVQCLANMGLLCVPLMLQSSGYLTGPLTPLETLSWGLWAISLGWEHLADSQKLNFARFPKTWQSIFCFDGLMKNALIMNWMRELSVKRKRQSWERDKTELRELIRWETGWRLMRELRETSLNTAPQNHTQTDPRTDRQGYFPSSCRS